MRYRPIGKSGMSISALCLKLRGERCGGDPDAWLALIHGAFENGVNAFEVSNPSPALLEGLAHAARSVERRLIFISLRLEDARIGRAWIAIREDELAAGAMGINTRNLKLLAFAMGATFGGLAGGLFAVHVGVKGLPEAEYAG